MIRAGIVGAGMAGLACAEILSSHGLDVRLFDKGRGPGGRMSTRRLSTSAGLVCIDHGAQYFTVRDPRFLRVVHAWQRRQLVAPWPEASADAWIGLPTMNAVIRDMARPHQVAFGACVKALEQHNDGWHFKLESETVGPFEIAVIAIPAEQAAPLLSLHDFEMACVTLRARSKPCWAGLFAFAERLPTTRNIIRDAGIITWAARNNAKPAREGTESWVVQAQPSWSETHCKDDKDEIAQRLYDALGKELSFSLPVPLEADAHFWRFAMTNGTGETAMWNPEKHLGACGDWLIGPRVEAAWISGHVLGQRIVEAVHAGALLQA